MDLTTTVTSRGSATVLAVHGDIDIATAPVLSEALAGIPAEASTHLIVDLDGVSFLDSSALAALVGANQALRSAGGTLSVACPKAHLLKIFTMTKLDRVIPLFSSLDEALAS